MKPTIEMDESMLNAFVDGQLDPALQRSVLQAMESDATVREQVCRLRQAKDWMQTGFADAKPAITHLPKKSQGLLSNSIAASFFLILLIGLTGGVSGYFIAQRAATGTAIQEDPNRIVLHLDESDPTRFLAVLDYAENFLSSHTGSSVQVEVVANAGGIDLMRTGTSPYQNRVKELSKRYNNLQFIACANALRNLRSSGVETEMLESIHTGKTAVDHIVSRLRDGWTYKRVSDLPGI